MDRNTLTLYKEHHGRSSDSNGSSSSSSSDSSSSKVLSTGVPAIDAMLGGGVRHGHVTEICARPGAGTANSTLTLTLAIVLILTHGSSNR